MNNTRFIRQTPVSSLPHRYAGSCGKWVSSRSTSALQYRYTGGSYIGSSGTSCETINKRPGRSSPVISFGLPNNKYRPVDCEPKVVVQQSNQRTNDQLPYQTIRDQLDEIVSQINKLNDSSTQITEADQVYIRKITDMFGSMTNGLDKYLPKAP